MARSTRDVLQTQQALGLTTDPVPVDVNVPLPETAPSDPQLDAAAAKEGIGFIPAVAASFRVDNSGYSLYKDFTDPRFAYDSAFDGGEYVKDPEVVARINSLTLADSEEVYEVLGEAYNQDHASFLLTRFEAKQADELALASGGGKALVARLGANVLDPIDLAVTAGATALTGGVGGAAYKGSKWGRILTAAGTAGLSNAAVEAYVARENPFRDETDVAFAGAAGILLGGSLSYLTRGENLSLEQLADKRARQILDSVGSSRRVIDGENEARASNLAPSSEKKLDEILDGADAPDFKFKILDVLTTNLRGKITNGTAATRSLFGRMFEGGFVGKDKVRSFTAEGRADAVDRALGTKFMARTDQHFQSWAKDNGYNRTQANIGLEAGEKFYKQVADALRGIDDPGISAQAKAAAKEQAGVLREVYDLAQRAGVKGFEGEPLDNFFPRIYDKTKFNRAINLHGEETMRSFFKEAILSGQDDITDALAGKFAKAMVRTLRRNASGIDQQMTHGIPLDDMDRLREVLTDGLTGDDLTRTLADIEDIASELERIKASKASDSGKVDRAKRRVRLDESFTSPVKTKDGQVIELKFTDLLHNDARAVGLRYIQVMSGHIGLAKEANIKSTTDFDNAVRGIISRGEAEGVDPQQLRKETEALRRGHRLLVGQSVEADPMGGASKLSRTVRDVNFTRSSGSFGLAQLAEYGNLIATAVGRAFRSHLPELQNLNKRALDGTLENNVARQLEEWFGPGTDFIRHPAIRGFDEFGEGFEGADGLSKFLSRADPSIQVGKRAASVVSLMGPIVSRMEKQASIAHVFEFSDIARKGGDALGDAKAARWRGAGLSDDTQKLVMAEMKKHVEWDADGRIKDLHVEKWDYDTADNFAMALRRQASMTIQRNDISDIPEAMRGPVGRLVFQFKAFMFGSIVKQLERGVHYGDIETFVAFSSSVFIASMAYVGQTYLQTFGNPEEREKKLQPSMIMGAGFARAGWTALLVPPAATFADMLGYGDVLNHRYSGLQASFLSFDQNPTTQLISSVLGTASALSTDLLSEDTRAFDRKDAERVLNILPFNRVLGVKNALHLIDE